MSRLRIKRQVLGETCLLLVLGCISGLAAGIASFYYVLLGLGVLLTVRAILHTVKSPEQLNVFAFFYLAVMIGYILGPSVAILYWASNPNASVTAYVGPFAFAGYRDCLSYSIMTAYIAGGLLVFVGALFRPITRIDRHETLVFGRADVAFLLVALVPVVAAIASGNLGYMGVVSGQEGEVTAIGGISGLILPAIVPVLVYGIANQAEHIQRRIYYLILLVGTSLALAVMGRRYLIFSFFIAFEFASMARPSIRKFLRPLGLLANPKKTVLTAIVIAMVMGGMAGFTAIRVATEMLGDDSRLADRIKLSQSILCEGSDKLDTQLFDVAMARPGILPGYLGRLEVSSGKLALGECLAYNSLNVLPRLLFRDKDLVLEKVRCTDESVNARFGLPQIDSPSTVLTRGYADFGLLGALLYLILVGMLFQLVAAVVLHSSMSSFRLLGLSAILNGAIFVETDLLFYFVTVRNLGIVYLLAVAVRFLSRVVSFRPLILQGHSS